MAERKAVNKYYPPEWDPSKGSINKFHGQHHLRERARKLDEGILIIRFEMPFNIWCLGCERPIGMGVRFNAEKKTIGKYYSTPIFSFRMKCPSCSNWMEIHTDPKNATYLVVEGARKKNEEWQAEKGDTILLDAEDLKEKRLTNAMFKLEHVQADKEIIRQAAPLISQLEKRSYLLWNDNFSQSSQVRKLFREKKSILERQKDDREKFREKFQLDPSVPVLDEIPEDLNKAQLLLSTSSISKGTSPTLARITKALKKRRKLGKSVV